MLLSIVPITVAANFVRVLALILIAYFRRRRGRRRFPRSDRPSALRYCSPAVLPARRQLIGLSALARRATRGRWRSTSA
jgi:hypothetical protein